MKSMLLFGSMFFATSFVWTLAQSTTELLYLFDPENCDQGAFTANTNSSYDLIRNKEITICPPSLGVRALLNESQVSAAVAAGVQSVWSTQAILRPLAASTTALSFELWFKTGLIASDSDLRPILTIGQQESLFLPSDVSVCTRYGVDLLIGMRGGSVELYYRSNNGPIDSCQYARIDAFQLETNTLAHVVASFEDKSQQIFVNGQRSINRNATLDGRFAHWNPNYRLHLLYQPSFTSQAWKGTLYQLVISSQRATMSNVMTRLRQGLPHTSPYAINYTVALHEDAEVLPESHPPEWYRQSPSLHDAAHHVVKYGSVDQEVEALLESIHLTPYKPSPPVFTYVSKLPDKGCLFQSDGSLIGCANEMDVAANNSLLVSLTDDHPMLVYIPPLNQYSMYGQSFTEIRYCVSDSPLFHPDQCMHGTIHIVVHPVNDPPIALPVPSVKVYEGLERLGTPKIMLSGTDVDMDDDIVQVQITKPPLHGYLILSVSSFRHDELKHGTKLSELNYTVNGDDDVFVKYIYNSVKPRAVVQGESMIDTFQFRVGDRSGRWSSEEKVFVTILSALMASSDIPFPVQEDSIATKNLRWSGNDTSGLNRRLSFFVESLPSTESGMLLDGETGQQIQRGTLLHQTLEYPYQDRALATFSPAPDYCNTHDWHTREFVSFRAVAFAGKTERVVSISGEHEQTIEVQCLIDPLHIDIPKQLFVVKTQSLPILIDTPCYGHAFHHNAPNVSYCSDHILVFGDIRVESSDRHVSEVSVSVATKLGYVTFNHEFWNNSLPIYGRRSITQNVSFLIEPDKLTDVLSGLHYQTLTPGRDSIDIILRYGACSLASSSSSPFQHDECQIIQHTIVVNALENQDRRYPFRRIGSEFPWQILICWIVYPAIYYGCVRLDSRLNGDSEGEDSDERPRWIQHKSDTGDYYYENTDDGTVTWLAPLNEHYIPWTVHVTADGSDGSSTTLKNKRSWFKHN
jgi:hypothetical protein